MNVKATGEGTNWWAQSVKKCVYSDYVHTDRLGSVVNLTDQYGRVPAQIDYDDWGKVTAYQSLNISGGYRTVLPEITYAGHQYDDVLGMYYAKARFYDPDAKRFVAVDPVKGKVTEPLSLVPYVYCVDNPLRWVDLLGKDPMSNYPSAYIQLSNGNVLDEVDWYIHGDPDDYYVDFEAALKAYGVNVGRGELTYSDGAGHQTLYLFSPDQRRYIETQLTYYTACNSISVSSLMREQAANWGVTQNYGNVMMYYSSNTYHKMINLNYFKRLMCDLGYNVTAELKDRYVISNSKSYEDFLDALGMRESSDNYNSVYQLGYMGRYQFGTLALKEIGWKDGNGNWTDQARKYGVTSKETFLGNVNAQEVAIRALHKRIWSYVLNYEMDQYIGKHLMG